jgi:hypothetical protein
MCIYPTFRKKYQLHLQGVKSVEQESSVRTETFMCRTTEVIKPL